MIERMSSMARYEQARTDLGAIQEKLSKIHAQIGSGRRGDDVKGFAGASGEIVSARSILAGIEAQKGAARELQGRMAEQVEALSVAANASQSLSEKLFQALTLDDGRGLSAALEGSFSEIHSAINANWNGAYVFGGERTQNAPLLARSTADLADVAQFPTPTDFFDDGAREQTIDLGEGAFGVAPRASAIAEPLFGAMRALRQELDAAGGAINGPLSAAQRTAISNIRAQFMTASETLRTAEGRNGDVARNVDAITDRLVSRGDLITKQIGDTVDADMAELATQLSQTTTQYQAAAQVFAQLKELSLLQFLR